MKDLFLKLVFLKDCDNDLFLMVLNTFYFLFSYNFKNCTVSKIKKGRLPSFHHFNF